MRLICPACGALWSAEAGSNDASCRTFMAVLVRIPRQVQDLVLPYLGLFRSGAKGLSWPRALRVIADLSTLLESGQVQWEGGETRPCPPEIWARAIDAVLTRRPSALTNHNYLRHCAWEMAKPLAADFERQRDRSARGREFAEDTGGQGDGGQGKVGWVERSETHQPQPAIEDLATDEDRAEMAAMMRKWLTKKG